jgi:hypothetical protein
MPHTAITTTSTSRCFRFRACRGSESDSEDEPIDSTFTHLAAMRSIPAGDDGLAARPSIAPGCERPQEPRCNRPRLIAQDSANCPSMRAGRGSPLQAFDVAELAVTVRVRRPGEPLLVGTEREAELLEEPPDRPPADGDPLFPQQVAEVPQAATDPFPVGHRVAAGLGLDEGRQLAGEVRDSFSTGGRPAPGGRTRSVGRPRRESSISRRPRRMVSTSRPVIRERRRSPP